MNTHFLKHLEQVTVMHRSGAFAGASDVVEKIASRRPKSFETFVRESITAFTGKEKEYVQNQAY